MQKLFILTLLLQTFHLTSQVTRYVNQNVIGGLQDGSSWPNAYSNLQPALLNAQSGDMIWVASGTYYPTAVSDRNASFKLVNNTALYGGFKGTETMLVQRDPVVNLTVLSGEIGNSDIRTDNSYHVVQGKNLNGNTIIDGFSITAGHSYGDFFQLTLTSMGAGMLLEGAAVATSSRPVISNCIFHHNAAYAGGGLCTTWENPEMPTSAKRRINPVLRNCSFQNNRAYYGGGGFFANSSSGANDTLNITGCSFSDNYAYTFGGAGVLLNKTANTNVHLSNCLFERDSTPLGGLGGAIFCGAEQPDSTKASFLIDSCAFKKNIAAEGSGIYYAGEINFFTKYLNTYFHINKCLFEENKTTNGGSGAAYLLQTSPFSRLTTKVTACIFSNNVSGSYLTLVSARNNSETNTDIERCLFLNNKGFNFNDINFPIYGGASGNATINKVRTRIKNCIFAKNAGGIAAPTGPNCFALTEITNCTFYRNDEYIFVKSNLPSTGEGYHNDMYLNNCVVWEKKTDGIRMFYNNNPDVYEMYGFHVEHTLITVPEDFYLYAGANEVFGSNIIYNKYPNFVDTLADDYHLNCSPAVDAGSNIVADTFGLIIDFDNFPRIVNNTVDMGAYERQSVCPAIVPQIRYVNQNVQGGLQDGSSWSNAFSKLQQALTIAQAGDSIWVATGVYTPSDSNDRTASFELVNGAALYGGFAGTETVVAERDPIENPTVLSGEIGIPNNPSDNSYNVVKGKGLNENTRIDGFTIKDGYSLLTNSSGLGAGILLEGSPFQPNSKPVINNCVFENNSATAGGALCTTWDDVNNPTPIKNLVNPVISNCTFNNNHAYLWGGAIYVNSSSGNADTLQIKNCSFTSNTTFQAAGGGLYFNQTANSNTFFSNCLFKQNSANKGLIEGSPGGAIYFSLPSVDSSIASLVLDSCTFIKNTALTGAGLYYANSTNTNKDGSLYLGMLKCRFEGNSTINNGEGAAFVIKSAKNGEKITTLISDCIFKSNHAQKFTASIIASNQSDISTRIEHCVFSNNQVENNPEQLCVAFKTGTESTNALPGKVQTRISNCVFNNNGGALEAQSGPKNFIRTDVINCTFFKNSQPVFAKTNLAVTPENYTNDLYINNSIVWEPNVKKLFDNGDGTAYGFHTENTLVTVPAAFYSLPGATEVFGNGMLFDLHPKFTDTLANDFHLLPCSPAVNAGSNLVVDTFGLITDLDGLPRILHDTVDLGAYENPDSCIMVASQEPLAARLQIQLSPNPAAPGGICNLRVQGFGFSKMQWIIWDAVGRKLAAESSLFNGERFLSLPAPASPGLYFIEVRGGAQARWLKLVVQE